MEEIIDIEVIVSEIRYENMLEGLRIYRHEVEKDVKLSRIHDEYIDIDVNLYHFKYADVFSYNNLLLINVVTIQFDDFTPNSSITVLAPTDPITLTTSNTSATTNTSPIGPSTITNNTITNTTGITSGVGKGVGEGTGTVIAGTVGPSTVTGDPVTEELGVYEMNYYFFLVYNKMYQYKPNNNEWIHPVELLLQLTKLYINSLENQNNNKNNSKDKNFWNKIKRFFNKINLFKYKKMENSTERKGATGTPGKGANDTFSTPGKGANFTAMECTMGKGANFMPMECTTINNTTVRDSKETPLGVKEAPSGGLVAVDQNTVTENLKLIDPKNDIRRIPSFYDLEQVEIHCQNSLKSTESLKRVGSKDSFEYLLFGNSQEYISILPTTDTEVYNKFNSHLKLDRFLLFGFHFNKLLNSISWLASIQLSCKSFNSVTVSGTTATEGTEVTSIDTIDTTFVSNNTSTSTNSIPRILSTHNIPNITTNSTVGSNSKVDPFGGAVGASTVTENMESNIEMNFRRKFNTFQKSSSTPTFTNFNIH